MALNAFEVYAKIGVDTTAFDAGLAYVNAQLRSFSGTATAAFSSFSSAASAASASLTRSGMTTETTRTATAFDKLRDIGTKALTGIGSAAKNIAGDAFSMLGNAASSAFDSIIGLAQKAGTAMLGFAKDSINTAADFNQTMSGVAATMGKTAEETQQLKEFAMEMGATTMFSAKEAAQGLNYMALAGYDAEKAMEMLPKVLDLAAAGGMQLGRASDMFTDAVSALQLPADKASDLIDQMAKAASSSNTSVSQLGEAILQIGGTAKDLKGGTVELATVLGILADNGMKGAEGGTHLRNMMNSLISPTKDAKEFMEAYGISLFDAQGEMRGLNEVFTDLNNVLSTMNPKERKQALTDLFNARDLKAAEALLAGMNGRFEQLSETIADSEGAAAKMSKTMMDNLAGDKKILESAIEGLKISFADGLTPILREGVQMATSWVTGLKAVFDDEMFQGIVKNVSGYVDTITKLLKSFGDNPKDAFEHTIKFINSRLKYTIRDLKKDAEKVMPEIGKMFESGLKYITSATQQILPTIGDAISLGWDTLVGVGKQIVPPLAQGLIDAAGEIGSGVTGVLTKIGEFITNPESFKQIFGFAKDVVVSFANGMLSEESLDKLTDPENGLPKFVKNLGEIIVSFSKNLFEAAGKIVDKLGDYLNDPENIKNIDEGAAKMITSLGESLVNCVGHLYKFAVKVAEALITYIVSAFKNLLENGGFVTELIKATQEAITGQTAEEHYAEIERGSESYDTTLNSFNDPDVPAAAIDAYLARDRQYSKFKTANQNSQNKAEIVPNKSGENISISFGNINVTGDKNVGQEVVKQIDKALQEMQIQRQRGIGMVWQ